MRSELRTLIKIAQIIGGFAVFGLMIWVPVAAGAGFGVFSVVFLLFVNGWAVYAFIHYRQSQQDEMAQLIGAAVAGGIPLGRAVRSYLDDQPWHGAIRTTLGWAAPFVVLPLYGYIRLCIGWRRFDQLVEDLADRLDAGQALSTSLREVPGIAARDTRLAAAIGEATNSLGPCLKIADRERWSAAWLEVAPRILYPFAVLSIVFAVTTFLMIAILPRFKRIFDEFGEPMPSATQALFDTYMLVDDFLPLLIIVMLLAAIAVALVIANSTVRWHTPILGRLYRWGMQATILRTLGRLLAAGQTVPQALEFLRNSEDLPPIVQRRLAIAANGVARGDTLDDALLRAELLPSTMGPLVRAAERVRTLPWALSELGDHLAGRAFRLVRRISLIMSPMLVVCVGAVVGSVALGMFMPLIQLLTRLSE